MWSLYLLWKASESILNVRNIILLILNNCSIWKFPNQESEQTPDYVFFFRIMNELMWWTKTRHLAFYSSPGPICPALWSQASWYTYLLTKLKPTQLTERDTEFCHLGLFCDLSSVYNSALSTFSFSFISPSE